MSATSMAIFSNPLFATYSLYAHNASFVAISVNSYCSKNAVQFDILVTSLPRIRLYWKLAVRQA